MDDRRRDSLVPPDPYAGRPQSGPMRLMLLGLAITAAAYLLRGRLAPAPRVAEAVAFQPPPATQPVVARPLRARPAPVDAFFPSIGGPDESPADPFAAASLAPPSKSAGPTPLRLQSIVIGPRRRVCMINDKPYVVGETVEDALIRAIGRSSVTVRRAGRDVVIALPAARP